MSRFCFVAQDEAETDRLGAAVAASLRPGVVVALNGELGAGKTRFVRSVVAALHGSDSAVNSPTFVIIQRYDGPVPVDHIDAYRLADGDEFLALGAEDVLGGDGVCLIEWAERVIDVLPDDYVRIDVQVLSPTSRRFELSAQEAGGRDVLKRIEETLRSQRPD